MVLSPPVTWHDLLTQWQTEWTAFVAWGAEAAAAGAYLVGVRRLAARGRRWSPWRTVSFFAGLLVVVVAIQSGLASYDDSNFTAHVVQHLLLMNVAPVLLALSAPITLLLQTAGRGVKTGVLKVLHSRPARILTNPLVAAGLAVGTMYAYFLTPLYRFSLQNQWFHDYTHIHFLLAGCLFYWPLVGRDVLPRRWGHGMKVLLLLGMIPWQAFLGIALLNQSTPIAPVHTLADTHAGGGLLWAASEFFTLGALLLVYIDWARSDTRQGRREDRRGQQAEEPTAAGADGPAEARGEGPVRRREDRREEAREDEEVAELVPARPASRRQGSTWAQTLAAIRRPGDEEDPPG